MCDRNIKKAICVVIYIVLYLLLCKKILVNGSVHFTHSAHLKINMYDLSASYMQTNSHKSFPFHLTNSVWPQGHWRPSIRTVFIWVNQCSKRQLREWQARLKLIQTRNNTQQEDTADADLAFIAKITESCRPA